MSTSVLYMSMSLDGYIAGPNDEVGNPGGDGFDLHAWFTTPEGTFFRPSGPAGEVYDEGSATGAVLIGRRLAEQIDHWGGDHHGGVPIFVVSHRPPDPSVANYPLVTYVTNGIESAMAQAKAAAGERNVLGHGAYTARGTPLSHARQRTKLRTAAVAICCRCVFSCPIERERRKPMVRTPCEMVPSMPARLA